MKLIIGGAYQGKRAFAKTAFSLGEEDIFTCHGEEIDFSAPCIDKIEEFTYSCVKAGKDPVAIFRQHEDEWKDAVLIGTDFSCGLVPMEAENRLWREENGRLNNYLAGEAARVVRMFCGIAQVIK